MIHSNLQSALAAANVHIVIINPYEEAFKLINDKHYGVNKAAKSVAMGIPKTNLKRWLEKKNTNPSVSAVPKHGGKTAQTDMKEKAIVETFIMLGHRGCGVIRRKVLGRNGFMVFSSAIQLLSV